MKCSQCTNELEKGKTFESREHKGVKVLFRDVPCLICPSCGETYTHDKELDIIEDKMIWICNMIDMSPDSFAGLRYNFEEVAKDYGNWAKAKYSQ